MLKPKKMMRISMTTSTSSGANSAIGAVGTKHIRRTRLSALQAVGRAATIGNLFLILAIFLLYLGVIPAGIAAILLAAIVAATFILAFRFRTSQQRRRRETTLWPIMVDKNDQLTTLREPQND
jgi:CHASE2 domain-containing sensor protein